MKTESSSTYTASDGRETAMSWASHHTVTLMLHVNSKVCKGPVLPKHVTKYMATMCVHVPSGSKI